jgi:hypothetical protein
MSNSASLSAAKRRRGGGPPVGQGQGQGAPVPPQVGAGGGVGGGGNLPPGLPPNFRQMPPPLQQQILRQMQQRMLQQQAQQQGQQAQQQALQAQQQAPQQRQNIPPVSGVGVGVAMSSNNMNERIPPQVSGAGPYVVNSVLHNRAISEVDGIHIRDLPMSAAGLPCLPSGAALPPNILFKLHHDELLNQDAVMNEHSNRLQMLTNRLDKVERGVVSNSTNSTSSTSTTHVDTPSDVNSLANNSDFIAKILDNILTNTNLSDIINQIEPLQKENESLRALIHSQQTTLNELSTLVMKLLNGNLPIQPHDNSEIHVGVGVGVGVGVDNFSVKYEDIKDVFCNYVNGCEKEAVEAVAEETHEEVEQVNDEEVHHSELQEDENTQDEEE